MCGSIFPKANVAMNRASVNIHSRHIIDGIKHTQTEYEHIGQCSRAIIDHMELTGLEKDVPNSSFPSKSSFYSRGIAD